MRESCAVITQTRGSCGVRVFRRGGAAASGAPGGIGRIDGSAKRVRCVLLGDASKIEQ